MNITITAYSPEGFLVQLTYDAKNIREALAFSAAAGQSGFTVEPVERREETIVTVVRREKMNDDGTITPVIDMYPAWKGEYGQYRFLGLYLNCDHDIAQFEAHSGLRLDDIPLYNSQGPLVRKPNRRHSHETTCRPFIARKRFKGEKMIDGKMQKQWDFVGYIPIAESADSEAVSDTPSPDMPDTPAPRGSVLPLPGKINPATSPRSSRSR